MSKQRLILEQNIKEAIKNSPRIIKYEKKSGLTVYYDYIYNISSVQPINTKKEL